MDLILRAQDKRDKLRADLARIEAFLATAYELEQDLKAEPSAQGSLLTDTQKADLPKKRADRPRSGIGAETIAAAEDIVEDRGPMSSRNLLPLILAKGIEVGGKDPVATLSARISQRGRLETYNGKWRFKVSGPEGSGKEEAADNPATDQSTASG